MRSSRQRRAPPLEPLLKAAGRLSGSGGRRPQWRSATPPWYDRGVSTDTKWIIGTVVSVIDRLEADVRGLAR